jgi:hypothetical protein
MGNHPKVSLVGSEHDQKQIGSHYTRANNTLNQSGYYSEMFEFFVSFREFNNHTQRVAVVVEGLVIV